MFWHKRKVNNSRILILGVLEEYRNKGIDIYLYEKIQENLKANYESTPYNGGSSNHRGVRNAPSGESR